MSTNYEAAPRATAAGVATVAILVVILSMGLSTLQGPTASQPGNTGSRQIAYASQAASADPLGKR
jgi:hypothetical protein